MRHSTGPRSDSATTSLPALGAPVEERADARRNRLKILDAAERLFAQHGVANVSMDAVAKMAGVGKGTLFRRFGDRAGLAVALLDERERELQERVLHGPAPLGPSAPARTRLLAFLTTYPDFLDAHGDIVLESETAVAGARYRVGAYRFWHRHVGCKLAYTPKTRGEFWRKKFHDNVRRDRQHLHDIEALGWRVLVIWECQIRDMNILADRLRHFFSKK